MCIRVQRTHMLLTFLSLFSSPPLPTLPFLIINLYKLHNFDPSSFGALLARSGLARSLKSVVVDDDWDAAVGKVEGEGKVDKEFGGKVKESVIY